MLSESTLSVTAVASSASLLDLVTLKSDLGIGDTSQDARLTRIIASVSQQIPAYVGRPLIEQTYGETWRLPPGGQDYWSVTLPRDQIRFLALSRTPVTVIVSVVEAGVTLDPSLYQWIDDEGLMRLDANGQPSGWASGLVTVAYKAGWVNPGTTPSGAQVALPADLYEAAINAAKAAFLGKDRDPGLVIRAEAATDLYQVQYDTRGQTSADLAPSYGLPAPVQVVLDAYRRNTFAL